MNTTELINKAKKFEKILIKNQSLFSFLETALLWFDTHQETTNFHLILMMEVVCILDQ